MRALVTGSSGFIGTHLVRRLKREGYEVWGVDQVPDREHLGTQFVDDLRDPNFVQSLFGSMKFDETYHCAADMGGAGYIFSGENDADVMLNSARINFNVARAAKAGKTGRLFFSSSACVYASLEVPWGPPGAKYVGSIHNTDYMRDGSIRQYEILTDCVEEFAYPARPDSEYGWEKLFAERLFLAVARNYGAEVRIARLHNVFGPFGAWNNGREKAPAAIARKVAQAQDGGEIEIWGDGKQQRSFLYIDECVEGIWRLMQSDFQGPVNLGSTEMITIDELVDIVCEIAGKRLAKRYVSGPTGVRGRNSNNELIREKLGWAPAECLREGLAETYRWVEEQVRQREKNDA
jgi:nucleoside-diphosphate-sugar epimerase